jgi:two-component system, cell cycle sensor histidine kinase and response regulator CckA
VTTQVVYLNETDAVQQFDCAPGEYIKISFSDDGAGMDNATLASIFEPFFSTKGELGTGLGLSTVYGIVEQHDGSIQVTSAPGKGTAFGIYLPVSHVRQPAESVAPDSIADTARGWETILVVEDEPGIRTYAGSILQRLGYKTLIAASGKEALAILRKHRGPIHLLLLDVIMPDYNGPALYETALASHPKLKALYMSGYTDNIVAKHGILKEGISFIQKPFTIQLLAQKLRSVLKH